MEAFKEWYETNSNWHDDSREESLYTGAWAGWEAALGWVLSKIDKEYYEDIADLTDCIKDQIERIDIIASKYEWVCPNCDSYHEEIEYKEKIACVVCGRTFRTNPPEHAFG